MEESKYDEEMARIDIEVRRLDLREREAEVQYRSQANKAEEHFTAISQFGEKQQIVRRNLEVLCALRKVYSGKTVEDDVYSLIDDKLKELIVDLKPLPFD